MHAFFSPFIIPLGAFAVAIVAIVSGIISQAHANRLRSQDRMALLARGVPIPDIERLLKTPEFERGPNNPLRSLANARRTAIVLISTGLGLVLFFVALSMILRVTPVLCGAAVGIIPLAIGVGFVIDYRLQERELSRFSPELAEDLSPVLRTDRE